MATSALALFDFDASGAATGYRLVDPAVPALTVTELAATRGDGVFETVGLHEGRPIKAARHFARFAESIRMLDLPDQNASVWDAALRDVAGTLDPAPEGWVKLVLSRGIEGGITPTGWAYATVSASTVSVRDEGLRVVLLDRGYPSDIAQTAPWLLQGAKTISYAINRSAYREAARRDADDVIFVASDGVLLEGPTSTLVLRTGDTLRTTPPDLGILAGTTQAELFEWAADLAAADAAWLVSSVRLAAPIRAVDGIPKPVDAALTASFTAHLHSLTG
jgi:4-amino-4-deoxychorismate lyase